MSSLTSHVTSWGKWASVKTVQYVLSLLNILDLTRTWLRNKKKTLLHAAWDGHVVTVTGYTLDKPIPLWNMFSWYYLLWGSKPKTHVALSTCLEYHKEDMLLDVTVLSEKRYYSWLVPASKSESWFDKVDHDHHTMRHMNKEAVYRDVLRAHKEAIPVVHCLAMELNGQDVTSWSKPYWPSFTSSNGITVKQLAKWGHRKGLISKQESPALTLLDGDTFDTHILKEDDVIVLMRLPNE